jgi:aquaporin Z
MIKYLVEFLGTFLFISVIIATGQPILIAIALLAVMLLGTDISGGHFNPAVSLTYWAKGALTNADFSGYILSQSLGGLGALAIFNALAKKNV